MARETARTTFYGLDVTLDIDGTLPTSAQVRDRMRQAMVQSLQRLHAAAVAQLSGGSVRRRSGRLIAALEQKLLRDDSQGLTGGLLVARRMQHIARFLEYGTDPTESGYISARGATKAMREQAYRQAAGRGRRRPTLARALAVGGPGSGVYRARVRSRGLRARHWLRNTSEQATPAIVALFQRALAEGGADGGITTNARVVRGLV